MNRTIVTGIAGTLAVTAAASAQMRITEYMYSGAGEEFIEFTNVGGEPIDLTGWSYDDDSQTPGTEDLSILGVVAPGASVIITEDDPDLFRAAWGLDASVGVRGFIKANIGRNDELNLYDADGMLVDRLTYGDVAFPGSIRTQGISGWGQAYGIGLNDAYSYVLSIAGDVQQSTASSFGDIGNPGRHALVNNVRLNEIRIDQPSDDFDEYVELRGDAGVSLEGLTLVVIGDGAGGSGVIDAAIPFSGLIPDDGHYLAVEGTHTLAPAEQRDLVTALNFENSDNLTFILVDGFTGAAGDDLDADDDCVLDLMPWANEYDRVALIEEENPAVDTECHYGLVTVGPDGDFVPGHAFRCDPTTDWAIGIFDPAGGVDTPGTPNAACPPIECELNGLQLNEIRADQPGGDDDEYIELTGPAGTSLDGISIVILGDNGNDDPAGWVDTVIDLSGNVMPEDGFFLIAEDADTFGELADLVVPIDLENGDNLSIFLVCDSQAVIPESDLDADNDGVLDTIPWGLELDSVTLLGADGVEPVYAGAIADGGAEVPGHALRCLDGADWGVGPLDPFAGGIDTPGAPNGDCVTPCPADFDSSGSVDFNDLVTLLAVFGDCPGCPEDLDGDGAVGFSDLLAVLGVFGPCP